MCINLSQLYIYHGPPSTKPRSLEGGDRRCVTAFLSFRLERSSRISLYFSGVLSPASVLFRYTHHINGIRRVGAARAPPCRSHGRDVLMPAISTFSDSFSRYPDMYWVTRPLFAWLFACSAAVRVRGCSGLVLCGVGAISASRRFCVTWVSRPLSPSNASDSTWYHI